MMDESQREQLGRRLIDERDRIAAALESAIKAPGDDRSLEDGLRQTEEDRVLRLCIELQAALRQIDYSLRKLELGTYGICDACGRDIPTERLDVRPQASRCVVCASRTLR